MKPFIKWQGGKRRELPNIQRYIPSTTTSIVEPFCGGAAVAFNYELPTVLNDFDGKLINLYKHVRDNVSKFLDDITKFKAYTDEQRSDAYYEFRSYLNANPNENSYEAAIAFLYIRQQCFSGMERYNSKGEFNVPWGRYKTFSCTLSTEHSKYLEQCDIINGDAIDCLDAIKDPNSFIFIDPPYLERAGYVEGDGGIELHQRLADKLLTMPNPFLIVHTRHDFYLNAYQDCTIDEIPFKYAQQFRKGNYDADVKHLYISNPKHP